MEFYDMKIHTVKYSRCTGGNNGGAGAVQGSEASSGQGDNKCLQQDMISINKVPIQFYGIIPFSCRLETVQALFLQAQLFQDYCSIMIR